MDTQKIGTREMFRAWLRAKHGMTVSHYNTLPTERKLAIQSQYQKKGA
jgi:hypothetical protein